MSGEGKSSTTPNNDIVASIKNQSLTKSNLKCSLGKSPTSSKPATINTIGINNGGKIRLRERRSNGGIKASQNPNRASYPSALLPTVTENRSVDNQEQYNLQSHQRTQMLNKENSETNLSIGAASANGVVGGLNSTTSSRNNSTERLSGTDGKYKHYNL